MVYYFSVRDQLQYPDTRNQTPDLHCFPPSKPPLSTVLNKKIQKYSASK